MAISHLAGEAKRGHDYQPGRVSLEKAQFLATSLTVVTSPCSGHLPSQWSLPLAVATSPHSGHLSSPCLPGHILLVDAASFPEVVSQRQMRASRS